jgi:hypothetical protein
MELEQDTITVLEDSLGGGVPAQSRPRRVRKERQVLVRSLPSRDRRRRGGTAKDNCGEEYKRPTHGGWTLARRPA